MGEVLLEAVTRGDTHAVGRLISQGAKPVFDEVRISKTLSLLVGHYS